MRFCNVHEIHAVLPVEGAADILPFIRTSVRVLDLGIEPDTLELVRLCADSSLARFGA